MTQKKCLLLLDLISLSTKSGFILQKVYNYYKIEVVLVYEREREKKAKWRVLDEPIKTCR